MPIKYIGERKSDTPMSWTPQTQREFDELIRRLTDRQAVAREEE